MVKRVLLLLNMEVREDMSAAIITAIIRPRSPVEGGNISLWLQPSPLRIHRWGSGMPSSTLWHRDHPHPLALLLGVTGEGAAWAKNIWERGHDLPLGISSTTSLG